MSNNDANDNNNNSGLPSQIGGDMWREIAKHLDLKDVASLSQTNKNLYGALHDHEGLQKGRKADRMKKTTERLQLTKMKNNYKKVLGEMYVMSDSELTHYVNQLAAAHIQGNLKEVDAIQSSIGKTFKRKS